MESGSQSPSLAGLRKAMGDFLDSLDGMLTTDSQQLTSKAPQLIHRMQSTHFQLQDTSSSIPEQLICKLEECKREIYKKLENRKFKDPSMTLQMSKTLERIWEEKRGLMKMKAECKDMIVMRAVLSTLQQQVKEKNEEIARLRRASIVQLWEREKQKVLCEALEREKALKEETEDKTAQWMEFKEKLMKKMKKLLCLQRQEEEIKKLRLKEKIYAKSLSRLETQELKEELKSLKQQLLLTEKELHESHCEILVLQKHTVAFLAGLKTDLQNVAVKQDSGYHLLSADFHRICSQLDVVCRAACDGSLTTRPVSSPETYLAPAQDVPVLLKVSPSSLNNGQKPNDQEVPEKREGTSGVNRSASATGKKVKKGRRRSKARPTQRSVNQSELAEPLASSLTPPSNDPPRPLCSSDQGKLTIGDDKPKDDQPEPQAKGQMTVPKAAVDGVQNVKLNPGQQYSHLRVVTGRLDIELAKCHNQSLRDDE
ncbi:fibrinogen- and Ig-binding protein-like isoform X2 [Heterodontus francisci]|uniref:fibrinogen- and Ig-binding protein-like isoform X2 n=1 Tax=Heterodontus francisci TaxID=7792 RepID=UPI00355C8686